MFLAILIYCVWCLTPLLKPFITEKVSRVEVKHNCIVFPEWFACQGLCYNVQYPVVLYLQVPAIEIKSPATTETPKECLQ